MPTSGARPRFHYDEYNRIVSSILAAHPGPARRLIVDDQYDRGASYNRWLGSPALNGLKELEIEPVRTRYWRWWDNKRALPERALHFARTLRLLRIGCHAFPSADDDDAVALRFPRLELMSLWGVDISEAALHGVLAGCPVLRTLDLDRCTGFATVRINSPTITSFAFSPANPSTGYIYDSDDDGPAYKIPTCQVTIEHAPYLEEMVPCRCWDTEESFRLRVVSAPRLRVLGFMSYAMPKLEIGGGMVFEPTNRRINRVRTEGVIWEKRLLMKVMLATTLRTVKILALKDVDTIDVVSKYLRCFPCLEKLYVSAPQGYRGAASYDRQNPIECLEHHLKMVALDGYEGKRSHLKFAQFFVRNARLLELMKFRTFKDYCHEPAGATKWNADQRRKLQIRNMASQHVKFHFVHDARFYRDVYCGENIKDLPENIRDSDPFHQWFESQKEPLAC